MQIHHRPLHLGRRLSCASCASQILNEFGMAKHGIEDFLRILRIVRLLKIVRLNPDTVVIQRALALSLRPLLVPLSFVRIATRLHPQPTLLPQSRVPRASQAALMFTQPSLVAGHVGRLLLWFTRLLRRIL